MTHPGNLVRVIPEAGDPYDAVAIPGLVNIESPNGFVTIVWRPDNTPAAVPPHTVHPRAEEQS